MAILGRLPNLTFSAMTTNSRTTGTCDDGTQRPSGDQWKTGQFLSEFVDVHSFPETADSGGPLAEHRLRNPGMYCVRRKREESRYTAGTSFPGRLSTPFTGSSRNTLSLAAQIGEGLVHYFSSFAGGLDGIISGAGLVDISALVLDISTPGMTVGVKR